MLFSIDALGERSGVHTTPRHFALHVEVISVLPTRTLEALGEQELDITRISSLLPFSVKEFLSVKDLSLFL